MASVEALHTITKGFSEACNINVFDDFEPVLLTFNGTNFTEPIHLVEQDDMYESIIKLVNTPGSMSNSQSFGFVAPAKASKMDNPGEKSNVMLYIWVQSPIEMTSAMWRQYDDAFEISDAKDSEGPLHHMLRLLSIRAVIDNMDWGSDQKDMEERLQKGVAALQAAMGPWSE